MNLNPFKRKADTAPIYDRIRRKTEILERIKKISMDLSILSGRKSPLAYDLQQTKNGIRGFTDERLERFPHERKTKDDLERKAGQMKDDLDKITQQMEDLEAERTRLKDIDLPGCIQKTSIAEVLAHQDVLKALRADAKRLEDAIDAQNKVIVEAKASIAPVQDVSARRAEILADIAIGEASQRDLEKLDAVTDGERKAQEARRAKAEPIINQATQTIAGLEAKLAEQERKISWKERDNPLILEQLLMSEISQTGALYVSHALALKETFSKLVALDTLLKEATGEARGIIAFNLTIPLPKLEECKEFAARETPDLLFTTKFAGMGNEIHQAWTKSERERLAGEGCEIL